MLDIQVCPADQGCDLRITPSIGAIFMAEHVHTGQVAAIKLQPYDEPCPTNRYERAFYPALQGGVGMPVLWAHGQQGYWDYLVIDLLGRSLDSLQRELNLTQDVWDLRSVCCVAIQMVSSGSPSPHVRFSSPALSLYDMAAKTAKHDIARPAVCHLRFAIPARRPYVC